jgi:hypothetical protein
MTINFVSPLSFVAVFGSGMGKNQDPGSAILILAKYLGYEASTQVANLSKIMKMRDHRNAPGIPGVNGHQIVQDYVRYSGEKTSVQNVIFLRALVTQHIQDFLAFVNVSFITVDNKKYDVTSVADP